MKVLAVITARGGSKGLPGKNIKLLNGKPLIYYSIDIAKKIYSDEDICISTDDLEIKNTVEAYPLKVPFTRPAYLAEDSSGIYEVLIHALDFYSSLGKEYDYLLLLQPTSPFRKEIHVEEIIELGKKNPEAEMIVSVSESKDNPYFNLLEVGKDGFMAKSKTGNFTRRQECPKVYLVNGSLYLIKVSALRSAKMSDFKKIVKYEMDEKYSVDIDTQKDWDYAEFLISRK